MKNWRQFLSQSCSVANPKPINSRHSNENRSIHNYIILTHQYCETDSLSTQIIKIRFSADFLYWLSTTITTWLYSNKTNFANMLALLAASSKASEYSSSSLEHGLSLGSAILNFWAYPLTILGYYHRQTTRGIVFLFTKGILRKIIHKSNRCFKLEFEWAVFSHKLS